MWLISLGNSFSENTNDSGLGSLLKPKLAFRGCEIIGPMRGCPKSMRNLSKRFIIAWIAEPQLLWVLQILGVIHFLSGSRSYKSLASTSHLQSLLLYLVTPKSHIGGDESNEYNFKWWTLVKTEHSVQIQWPYRPPMVHRKRDSCQHILLSRPNLAKKKPARFRKQWMLTHRNRKLFRSHYGKWNSILQMPLLYISPRSVWKCRESVLRSTNRPGRMWSGILFLPCGSFVRQPVQCGKILPGHRPHGHEKEHWWIDGDDPGYLRNGSIQQSPVPFLWKTLWPD